MVLWGRLIRPRCVAGGRVGALRERAGGQEASRELGAFVGAWQRALEAIWGWWDACSASVEVWRAQE